MFADLAALLRFDGYVQMSNKQMMRDPASLTPYALNAKMHDEKQVDKIAASIKKFGWRGNPIVIDENDEILAGHGRRLAAIKLGIKVPVEIVTDLTEDEKRAYRLADNRVAISNLDTELLQQELSTLSFSMEELFDKKELDFVMADLGTLNDEAFVADLDSEIAEQAKETIAAVSAASEKQVPIAKALGFKSVRGSDERAIAMFMAGLEEETGKEGAAAFMEFINTFSKAVA